MSDTSEVYVRMCDHSLIQEQWIPEFKEYYQWWDVRFKEIRRAVWTNKDDFILNDYRKEFIWLPLQHQIQEMMGKTDLAYCLYQDDIGDEWGGELYRDRDQIFAIEADSPEQLWLAFYMQEKQKLKWSGTKWESK